MDFPTGTQRRPRTYPVYTPEASNRSTYTSQQSWQYKDENQKWPYQPQRLPLSIFNRFSRVLVDLCLVVLSLSFIALGALAIILRGSSESKWGNSVLEATKVAPTVWPIVFAAIISSSLRALAHRKVQRGTTIGCLEQLMGSQTLFSAFKYAFALRSFTLSTLLLLILWTINPIGGQASLRMISLDPNIASESPNIAYLASNPLISLQADVLVGASSYSMYRPYISSLYGTTLFAPEAATQYSNKSTDNTGFDDLISRLGGLKPAVRRVTTDIWGNIRIPVLHLLPGYDSLAEDLWVEVPTDQIPPYSSIIGIPLRQLPPSNVGNLTFNIETNYHRFDCSDWTVLDGSNDTDWWQTNRPLFQINNNMSQSPFSMGSTGFFLDTKTPIFTEVPEGSSRANIYWNNDTSTTIPARDIIFGSRGHDQDSGSLDSITSCLISMEYVEVQVFCTRSSLNEAMGCSAVAIRSSQQLHLSSNWTEVDVNVGFNHLSFLPVIFGSQHMDTSTPQEVFMFDPITAFTEANLLAYPVIMSRVPIEVFQNRLALVFNTFFGAVLSPTTVAGGKTDKANGGDTILANTTARWEYLLEPVYKAHMGWLALYFGSVALLCYFAIWAAILRFSLDIPKILGNISTLTRDSLFIITPSPASTLEGDKRARLLKKTWVRLQDVQPERTIGRIALSSNSALKNWTLQSQRLYE